MRILAFESSAKAASVALLADGKLMAEYFQDSGQTHSRTLMLLAENMIKTCDLSVNEIDAVAVAAGPGSFTGVRIGVAAAKGFAWGRELPCYGVSTLEAMAYNLSCLDGILVPAMDARRSQVYTAVFKMENGAPYRMMEDSAISVGELGTYLKNLGKPKFLVGDGAELCYNTLGNDVDGLRLVPEHLRMQRAGGVALAAQVKIERGECGDAAALTPTYLRLSQAERERMARLNSERS